MDTQTLVIMMLAKTITKYKFIIVFSIIKTTPYFFTKRTLKTN